VWFDPNTEPDGEDMIQYVVSRVRCGHCGSQYHPDDVHVLDHGHDMWTLIVRCPQCHTHALVMALLEGENPSLMLREDKVGEDYQDEFFEDQYPTTSLPDDQPITDEDVAAWREFLENFHGDMHDLLAAIG
jgi:hypothetical protein